MTDIPQWLKFGVPRYLRHAGMIYRLPRRYRKRLQRQLDSWIMGTLFAVTYEMYHDQKYEVFNQAWRR